VKPGTIAYLSGSHGNLTLRGRKRTGIALIAGGVGIAPLLSIARQCYAEDDKRPIILLYGNRVAKQIVFKQELDQLAALRGGKVVYVVSETKGNWKGLTG
jgi:NAD(P)H-flavin reductase